MFCPSMMQHRAVTPPAVPNGATDFYMTRTYTMAPMASAREEVDGNYFAHSSVPVKFVPYNNVTYGHGGNDAPYVQPVSLTFHLFLCIYSFNIMKYQIAAIFIHYLPK